MAKQRKPVTYKLPQKQLGNPIEQSCWNFQLGVSLWMHFWLLVPTTGIFIPWDNEY